jgi:hypothetical protein
MDTVKTASGKTKGVERTQREAFNAILLFVNDLWDVFGNPKKVAPLTLYHRLITSLKVSDMDSMNKVVDGFKRFLRTYELPLLKGKIDEIPANTKIMYGNNERICLEIQKYFYQSKDNEETTAIIRQHLLTIGMILDPKADKITELENVQRERDEAAAAVLPGIDINTKEGQFINDILETAKNGMEGVDTSDPMQAMMGVYRSGAFQKMMGGMKDGSMNPRALGKMMKKTLNALIPDDEEETPQPPKENAEEETPKLEAPPKQDFETDN